MLTFDIQPMTLFNIKNRILPLFLLLFPWTAFGNVQIDTQCSSPVWQIDFTSLSDSAANDLQRQGFVRKKAMKNPQLIELTGSENRLNIVAKKQAFGLLSKEGLQVEQVDHIEIDWGIDLYPEAADWNNGKNREALMIYFFLGEPVQADHFYLPDVPYFIGIFLGKNEITHQPLTGKSYSQTGRYVCLANPSPGKSINSRFQLAAAFRRWFNTETVPPVTGIAIEVDTEKLPVGKAAAFISSIRLCSKE